ncbi:hypothetical protein CLF_101082 [Clonorchis sinensis]|uniref:Uncharacterized protein n=1 Tax=Clonorchis sinensis TaxID=79923 RepID=G7Y4Y9_CLOSI|nr:hypothetical protein CLF_101082 [Clonorchis sinensis]
MDAKGVIHELIPDLTNSVDFQSVLPTRPIIFCKFAFGLLRQHQLTFPKNFYARPHYNSDTNESRLSPGKAKETVSYDRTRVSGHILRRFNEVVHLDLVMARLFASPAATSASADMPAWLDNEELNKKEPLNCTIFKTDEYMANTLLKGMFSSFMFCVYRIQYYEPHSRLAPMGFFATHHLLNEGKSVAADRLDGDVVVMHRANQTSYTDLNLWKRQAEIVAENQASQIWAKIHRVRKNSSEKRSRVKNLLVVDWALGQTAGVTTSKSGDGGLLILIKRCQCFGARPALLASSCQSYPFSSTRCDEKTDRPRIELRARRIVGKHIIRYIKSTPR